MFYQKKKKEKNREQGGEKITKEMIHENLSDMRKVRGPLCVQHSEQQKQRYGTLSIQHVRDKGSSNPFEEDKENMCKGSEIRTTLDFSRGALEVSRLGRNIFIILREKDF